MKSEMIGDIPRCPNHGEPLELDFNQLGQTSGKSPCPVSKCLFEWTQIPEKEVDEVDKYGTVSKTKVFNVDGNEK